jgi:GTP cyclohydrolase I
MTSTNNSNDPNLGQSVHEKLVELNLETPMEDSKTYPLRRAIIHENQIRTMKALNLNLEDDSLRDTPQRVAKMYAEELFYGLDYDRFPRCTTVENKMHLDEVVATEQIEVNSMCEHHFIPFVGDAYVAYIPATKILGLSKFNRVVDFFSRRPQIQERLTCQISAAFQYILATEDIAVVIRAQHFCTRMRGVKAKNPWTTTSALAGRFRSVPELRAEFFQLIRRT